MHSIVANWKKAHYGKLEENNNKNNSNYIPVQHILKRKPWEINKKSRQVYVGHVISVSMNISGWKYWIIIDAIFTGNSFATLKKKKNSHMLVQSSRGLIFPGLLQQLGVKSPVQDREMIQILLRLQAQTLPSTHTFATVQHFHRDQRQSQTYISRIIA